MLRGFNGLSGEKVKECNRKKRKKKQQRKQAFNVSRSLDFSLVLFFLLRLKYIFSPVLLRSLLFFVVDVMELYGSA